MEKSYKIISIFDDTKDDLYTILLNIYEKYIETELNNIEQLYNK